MQKLRSVGNRQTVDAWFRSIEFSPFLLTELNRMIRLGISRGRIWFRLRSLQETLFVCRAEGRAQKKRETGSPLNAWTTQLSSLFKRVRSFRECYDSVPLKISRMNSHTSKSIQFNVVDGCVPTFLTRNVKRVRRADETGRMQMQMEWMLSVRHEKLVENATTTTKQSVHEYEKSLESTNTEKLAKLWMSLNENRTVSYHELPFAYHTITSHNIETQSSETSFWRMRIWFNCARYFQLLFRNCCSDTRKSSSKFAKRNKKYETNKQTSIAFRQNGRVAQKKVENMGAAKCETKLSACVAVPMFMRPMDASPSTPVFSGLSLLLLFLGSFPFTASSTR